MSAKSRLAKRNFKKWLAKHGGWVLIGSVGFCIIGLACIALGFWIAGSNLLAWFSSRWAFMVYAAVIIWAFVASYLWYWGKMGDDSHE
jgi:drug/metabolite transporter (DMT)-like permease